MLTVNLTRKKEKIPNLFDILQKMKNILQIVGGFVCKTVIGERVLNGKIITKKTFNQ